MDPRLQAHPDVGVLVEAEELERLVGSSGEQGAQGQRVECAGDVEVGLAAGDVVGAVDGDRGNVVSEDREGADRGR